VKKKHRVIVVLWLGASLLSLSPVHAQDLFTKAQGFENEQRWSEAFSTYSEILKHDPTNALAHYRLGAVREKLGATDDALRSYQEAPKSFSDSTVELPLNYFMLAAGLMGATIS